VGGADGAEEEETGRFMRGQQAQVHATLMECFAGYEASCKKGKYDLKELQSMVLVLRALITHLHDVIADGWQTRSLCTGRPLPPLSHFLLHPRFVIVLFTRLFSLFSCARRRRRRRGGGGASLTRCSHPHTHTVNVIEKLLYKENKPEVHVALPSIGHTHADLARRSPAGGWRWLVVRGRSRALSES
jgi:hypothetical protein